MKKIMLLSVVAVFLGISIPHAISANLTKDVQTMTMEGEYTEINVSELPGSITSAISEKYPGYTVEKAFKGKDGTFKVAVSNAEGKLNLIYNEKGEFVKILK
jgi:hypothetical protein